MLRCFLLLNLRKAKSKLEKWQSPSVVTSRCVLLRPKQCWPKLSSDQLCSIISAYCLDTDEAGTSNVDSGGDSISGDGSDGLGAGGDGISCGDRNGNGRDHENCHGNGGVGDGDVQNGNSRDYEDSRANDNDGVGSCDDGGNDGNGGWS